MRKSSQSPESLSISRIGYYILVDKKGYKVSKQSWPLALYSCTFTCMACRAVSPTTTIRTRSHVTKFIGVGGGEVIARGRVSLSRRSPSPNNNNNHLQKSYMLNDNKSASLSRGVDQAHLLNSHSQSRTESELTKSAFAKHEMAGDIRIVDGKKARKQWTLRDNSAMSVHLLKANLAEDGDDEAQLDIAKKLLHGANTSSQKENSRLAIYWLIKSSEQGNDEATRLLKECLSAGRGITGQNILDVRTCISTPINEKLTFRAARLLYLKLNDGEEFITTTQLLSHILETRKILENGRNETLPESRNAESTESSTHSSFTEHEEILSSSNIAFRKSFLSSHQLNETFTYSSPNTADVSKLSNPNPMHQNQSNEKIMGGDVNEDNLLHENKENFFASEMIESQEGLKLTIEDLLKTAGSFNSGENPYPAIDSRKKVLGKHNWRFACQLNFFVGQILFLSALLGAISWRVSCLYGSAFFSVWASFNLLLWRKRHTNFNDWGEAFKSVLSESESSWSEKDAENKLSLNLVLPYLLTIIGAFGAFSMIEGLNPLKFIVGGLVMFSLFRGIMDSKMPSYRVIAIFSIAASPNILPVLISRIENVFELEFQMQVKSWLSNMHKELVPELLMPEMNTVIFTLQIILILSLIWTTRNNFLQKNLPEVVFAFWFLKVSQISMENLSGREIGASSIACILLILTLITFESQLGVWKTTLAVLGIILMAATIALSVCVVSEGTVGTCLKKIQSPSNLIATNFLNIDVDELEELEWEEYDQNCHRKAWKTVSPAATQVFCFNKYGHTPTSVRWNAQISVVKVREITSSPITNSIEDISFDLNINIIRTDKVVHTSWQSYLNGPNEHGNPVPATIIISTKNFLNVEDKQKLMDHILNFRSGDKVEFHGIISPNSIGSLKPEIIHVQSLKCLSCSIAENYVELIVGLMSKEKVVYSQSDFSAQNVSDSYFDLFQSYIKVLKSYFIAPPVITNN